VECNAIVEKDSDNGIGYAAHGLGYAIEILPNGMRIIAHGGSNREWRTHFAAIPEKGEGIVILTNSDRGDNPIMDVLCMWIAWAVQALPPKPVRYKFLGLYLL
jgi:hypothetical protein